MRRAALLCAAVFLYATAVSAQPPTQPPTPTERVTFDEAIARATSRNPSAAIAAAGILRAEALLAQARSSAGLQVNGNVTSTTLNRSVAFEGTTVTPRSSVTGTLDLRYPLYAPAVWARRVEAQDSVEVAGLSAAETRRQTALATSDAYLAVIARRRVIDSSLRARDAAQAHVDLASELEQRGSGSRLNRVRAQQELSVDDGLIESARLLLYRAQEALGVLLAADGPVDAADEPDFDTTPAPGDVPQMISNRADLRLFAAEERSADRVLADNRKSYLPVFEGIFQPQSTYPAQFFVPSNTWRVLLQLDIPIFDSGYKSAEARSRQSAVDVARATRAGATTSATSEVRMAREAMASADRELVTRRAAAAQAQEVVDIVNISFRAGASTNIEVIDAERRARDADLEVVLTEDALRRARLDLRTALGLFP